MKFIVATTLFASVLALPQPVPGANSKVVERQSGNPFCTSLWYSWAQCCDIGAAPVGENCFVPSPVPTTSAAYRAACGTKTFTCCNKYDPGWPNLCLGVPNEV